MNFLEEDFPSIGEVKKDLELYKLHEQKEDTPSHINNEEISPYLIDIENNRSDPLLSGRIPNNEDSQDQNLRISQRGNIPRRRFEIEGESFLCASIDVDEPASYQETITSPNSEKWIVAMKDEIDSMAKNDVWELIFHLDAKQLEINGS